MNRAERRSANRRDDGAACWNASKVQLLTSAVRLHQAGRLDEAIASYSAAIKNDPRLYEAYYNRGIALRQKGSISDAIASFKCALELRPDDPETHNGLGNALADREELAEAVACYTRAINLRPEYSQAYANLGQALRRQKRLEEAAVCIRRALSLDPTLTDARFNLGITLAALGEQDAAIACFQDAIARRPHHAETYYNLAVTLQAAGRLDEAVERYRDAIRLQPDFVEALSNLGEALRQQGRLEDAAEYLNRALVFDPSLPRTLNNLGAVLTEQGRAEEAVACFRRALQTQPDFPEAQDALGSALQALDQPDEAAACYQRSLALRPEFPEAESNLGLALQRMGRVEEAIACYRRSIALRPDYADAHFHLGMALLSRGAMEEGWREYEWRWQTSHMVSEKRAFSQPQWRGEPGDGRTLLIHAEQGFGDTLQFCRYAAMAAARGWRIVMEVPRPLVRLLSNLAGVDQVVARGATLPAFDRHCPMLSLPMALGTTMESIPSAPAYLHPAEESVAAWRERLLRIGEPRLRIGLVWAGNPRAHVAAAAAVDRRRSMSPQLLAPLFAIRDVQFFSLQKDGPPAADDSGVIDVMGEVQDFADTAALIANLDLVIAVDTAVAHLAAGVGTPVWLLDRFDPCWRWFSDRRDSPWYPALRIYRQTEPGDWAPVIAEVTRDLRNALPSAPADRLPAEDAVAATADHQEGDDPVAQIESLDPAVFPAGMAMGHNDRLSLLLVHKLVRNARPGFRYLELASRFSGTLVPFLLDPSCELLITVTTLPEPHQPAASDQAADAIDGTVMQDVARRIQPGMLQKVAALECAVSGVPVEDLGHSIDLALLDGTHTNATAFRSFMHLLPLLQQGGIAVFQDARPLQTAIDHLDFMLTHTGMPHALHYLPDSIAVISLGSSVPLAEAAFRLVAHDRPAPVQTSREKAVWSPASTGGQQAAAASPERRAVSPAAWTPFVSRGACASDEA